MKSKTEMLVFLVCVCVCVTRGKKVSVDNVKRCLYDSAGNGNVENKLGTPLTK